MAGDWRRLLTFFRDIRIRQTSDGVWERQTPLSVRPLSPQSLKDKKRLAQAVLRSEIEMGRKRESDSPDGPPPQNVKFDPGSLRRRSFSVRKSTKRYAMGQPPGATSPKKAKGMFYNPDLGDVAASIKDSDAWGTAKLAYFRRQTGFSQSLCSRQGVRAASEAIERKVGVGQRED